MSVPLLVGATGSTLFMFSVVSVSAVCAVLIALDLLSLKHRSTNRFTVIAAILFLLGCIVANLAVGLGFTGQAKPVLATSPGRVALVLLGLGFLGGLLGLVQMSLVPRFRRGRKRGVFTVVFALLATGFLYFSDYRTRHPRAPESSSTKELINLDPNMAVPSTPTATPPPAPADAPARPISPD